MLLLIRLNLKYKTTRFGCEQKKSGLFNSVLELGAVVSKTEVLGFINDPFGGRKSKVVSSHEGIIIGQNNNPIVHKGDAVIHIEYN